MKKKHLLSVLLFPLFFVAFSEGLSIKKDQIFNEWATGFLVTKTGSESGEIPEIEPKEDPIEQIVFESGVACEVNLINDIKYIRDKPKRRTPIINILDVYRKLFFAASSTANNVVAYAVASGYWSDKAGELETLFEEREIDTDSESYIQWHQQIKDEITSLEIVETEFPGGKSGNTPEELVDHIMNYSLQEIPFLRKFFLKSWDISIKERAQTLYQDYKAHIKEDDLIKASVDLFNLHAIKESQERVMRDLDTFIGSDYYNFEMFIIFEIISIALFSAAATSICFMLLYYRENPAVLPGLVTGGFVAVFYTYDAVILLFALAGAAAILLSYRMYKTPLSYKESAILSLKAGLVLFLAQYVVSAVFNLAGIMQAETGQGFPSLDGGFSVLGVYLILGFLIICFFSVIGGVIANIFCRRQPKSIDSN